MKATILFFILALALPAAALSSSSSTASWRIVKSKSASGQFAATAISATIRHPRGIAVRFAGGDASGTTSWACTKGFSVSSWARSYGRGLHILGHVVGKNSCDVVASVAGSGRVTVQILKWG
jgi:hypothetical protein